MRKRKVYCFCAPLTYERNLGSSLSPVCSMKATLFDILQELDSTVKPCDSRSRRRGSCIPSCNKRITPPPPHGRKFCAASLVGGGRSFSVLHRLHSAKLKGTSLLLPRNKFHFTSDAQRQKPLNPKNNMSNMADICFPCQKCQQ